ncbi:hypothetical protein FKW44_021260, partial [Caligus rogercresseyi]
EVCPPKECNEGGGPPSPSIAESWTWGEAGKSAHKTEDEEEDEPHNSSTFDLKVDAADPIPVSSSGVMIAKKTGADGGGGNNSLRRRRLPSYDSRGEEDNREEKRGSAVLRTHSALETGAFSPGKRGQVVGALRRSHSHQEEEPGRKLDDDSDDVISRSPLLSVSSIHNKLFISPPGFHSHVK